MQAALPLYCNRDPLSEELGRPWISFYNRYSTAEFADQVRPFLAPGSDWAGGLPGDSRWADGHQKILNHIIYEYYIFSCYDDTLQSLVDKHAPFADVKLHAHLNAQWYDSRCQIEKLKTRRLEHAYRREKSEESFEA